MTHRKLMMDSSVPLDMWHVISNFFVVEPSSSHYEDQALLKVYHNSLWMKQHGTITDAHLRRGSNSHTNMVVHPQKFNGKISNMQCQDNALHSKCKLNLIFQNDLGLHLGGKLDRFCWLFKITDDAHYRYEAVKRRIRQATLLPLLQPEVFSKLGIKAPSGLLLYGPSGTTNTLSHHVILFLMVHMWLGCGKTAFVQALASESMLNVISIKGYVTFFSCHAITPCSCLYCLDQRSFQNTLEKQSSRYEIFLLQPRELLHVSCLLMKWMLSAPGVVCVWKIVDRLDGSLSVVS